MKRVEWLGDSHERIREFPEAAKREAGYQLERVQAGKEPVDWKPMPSVGLGVNEIRVRLDGAFRLIYVAKFQEAGTCSTPSKRNRARPPRKILSLRASGSGHWFRRESNDE